MIHPSPCAPTLFATQHRQAIEHAYDHRVEEVTRRWWNGIWGRLARRDVWLIRETRWKVVARGGDVETGKVLRWEFDTEPDAMIMVQRLLKADTAGQWREQATGDSPVSRGGTSSAWATPPSESGPPSPDGHGRTMRLPAGSRSLPSSMDGAPRSPGSAQ